jgi:hypothetical protein
MSAVTSITRRAVRPVQRIHRLLDVLLLQQADNTSILRKTTPSLKPGTELLGFHQQPLPTQQHRQQTLVNTTVPLDTDGVVLLVL